MRDSIFQAKPLHIALASLMLGLVVIFYLSMQSMTLYLGNERDLRVADDKVERVSRELNGVFDAELLPMKSAIKNISRNSIGYRKNPRSPTWATWPNGGSTATKPIGWFCVRWNIEWFLCLDA
ncbi:MAG: hypothetical protein K2Y10_07870 [Burkholderiaceae bacterium]|nr:hypothetical protein [Burkholderiaceae bacterium]MBY0455694.1 hypothetical protein [Burkholderiaceae bacterium]